MLIKAMCGDHEVDVFAFQYSIGDAVLRTNGVISIAETHSFQYSIGDAATTEPRRLTASTSFFQYSIGDAVRRR